MTQVSKIADAFDDARLVRWNYDIQAFFVWHGGSIVNVYDVDLNAADCFTFMEKPDVFEVIDAIDNKVEEYNREYYDED